MNIKLVGILFAVGSLLACGDSGTGGAGGGGASNPGGSDPGGSDPGGSDPGGAPGTGGSGGAAEVTCDQACDVLFNCGLEGTPPNCVYTAADEDGFVPECIAGCMAQPALIQLVDGEDCAGTVMTVSTVNAAFGDFCENGAGQGGAGGAQ